VEVGCLGALKMIRVWRWGGISGIARRKKEIQKCILVAEKRGFSVMIGGKEVPIQNALFL